ncbi:MAG: COX15/CtaA family protein [Candidatus Omnitrophica bacterium]|nr:COX15/CtaA family protein [Candidatus Omnitrophota bacterium]
METKLVSLRRFSKFMCLLTFSLIFLGALVKSTESGLSVPDWPTTYGKFMFAFPLDQMAGGIKYEHTHRMLASIVGLLTLGLCIWLLRSSVGTWIKRLGIAAFVAVVAQGVLGGLAVRYFLPVWLSTFHGVLAHLFLIILIMIAYGLSMEHNHRRHLEDAAEGQWIKMVLIFTGMVFIQLILGNIMRHTQSGLAIPDFPTMGGSLWPTMDQAMLNHINAWRFENNMDPVTKVQVHIHLWHRIWALLILLKLGYINYLAYKKYLNKPLIIKTLFLLNIAVALQIMLGISTVLFMKEVVVTTCHVTIGAFVLGLSFLLLLRSSPCTWDSFKKQLKRK